MRIGPQAGPQEMFLGTKADIAIYGGAAFGGKTYALLIEPLRHINRAGFDAVVFRRTHPQIMNPGGLWDTAMEVYQNTGGTARIGDAEWVWPSGHKVKFAHMQHEKDKLSWQGSAVPLLCFDELTHFSRGQFFYLLSRNRMARGAPGRPYVRASCNPDPNSWVAEMLDWWLDPLTGLPIPERSGVIRYFGRDGDKIIWSDTPEGIEDPRTFTFIPSKITDNVIGNTRDPGYLGNLKALPMVEREQLLYGNWKIRPAQGMVFRREWFKIVDKPAEVEGAVVRYWDRAATEPNHANRDPDWTRGVKVWLDERGVLTVLDVASTRSRPEGVVSLIKQTADIDGDDVEQWLEEDPGQAGKVEASLYSRELAGKIFRFVRPTGSKYKRSLPASAQAEAGNMRIVRGPWNEDFLAELQAFADWESLPAEDIPNKIPHDDQVDGLSGACGVLLRRGIPAIY